MSVQKTWQKFGDKILNFVEPTPEEVIKAREVLGEDFPLFEKFRNGTLEEKQEARNELTVKNLRLVYQIANWLYKILPEKLLQPIFERDDLVQEGSLGLMRAIETYDYTKGFRFSTYAFYWIREFIFRSVQNKASVVRIPVYLQKKIRKIMKVADSLWTELGRGPSREEVFQASGISSKESEEAIEKAKLFQHVLSLEAQIEGSEDEENFVEALEKKEISAEFRKKIGKIFWLAELNPQEQYFLERFFGLDGAERETLQKIGNRQGITRERMRQIIEVALRKIQTPEMSKIAKTLFPEYKVPEPKLPQPWKRAFKLLKLVGNWGRKGKEWTPESLIQLVAYFFETEIEQLRKSNLKKDEALIVARNTAICLLSIVCGMSKARISSFLNVKEESIIPNLTKFYEMLKLWDQEALWAELRFPKTRDIPGEMNSQYSVILNLLQNTNASYSEIANLLNVSKGAVERIAQKAGINGKSRMQLRWQERREKVLEEILNHPEMTYNEISELLGLNKSTLRHRLRSTGFKRRNSPRPSPEIASRNVEILIAAQKNPDLTYEEIGKRFNLSDTQVCLILKRQGFQRFRGWHNSRSANHKIKPNTREELKARNRKILEIIQNNPKLTYHQIGKMFGLSGLTIKEIAQEAGVLRRPRGSTKKREDITFERVFKLLEKKRNLRVVAKELKCSEQTLRRVLRRVNQKEAIHSK